MSDEEIKNPRHWPNVTSELRMHRPEAAAGVCSRAREEIFWLRNKVMRLELRNERLRKKIYNAIQQLD